MAHFIHSFPISQFPFRYIVVFSFLLFFVLLLSSSSVSFLFFFPYFLSYFNVPQSIARRNTAQKMNFPRRVLFTSAVTIYGSIYSLFLSLVFPVFHPAICIYTKYNIFLFVSPLNDDTQKKTSIGQTATLTLDSATGFARAPVPSSFHIAQRGSKSTDQQLESKKRKKNPIKCLRFFVLCCSSRLPQIAAGIFSAEMWVLSGLWHTET